MKIKSKQSIYVSVLVTTLGGLAMDKLMLDGAGSGPASASAAIVGAADNGQAATSAQTASSSQPSQSTAPGLVLAESAQAIDRASAVADQLRQLGQSRALALPQMRDAFVPGTAWVVTQPDKQVSEPEHDPVGEYVASHQLSAVLTSGGRGLAYINGEPVRVGESVDGLVLRSVTGRSAVLASGDVRVELLLHKP